MDKELLKKIGGVTGLSGGAVMLIFYLHNTALAKIDKAVDQISLNKTDIAVLKEIKSDISEIKSDLKYLLRKK